MFEPTDRQHFTRCLLTDERILGVALSYVERTEIFEPYRQLCLRRSVRLAEGLAYPSTTTCLLALVRDPSLRAVIKPGGWEVPEEWVDAYLACLT